MTGESNQQFPSLAVRLAFLLLVRPIGMVGVSFERMIRRSGKPVTVLCSRAESLTTTICINKLAFDPNRYVAVFPPAMMLTFIASLWRGHVGRRRRGLGQILTEVRKASLCSLLLICCRWTNRYSNKVQPVTGSAGNGSLGQCRFGTLKLALSRLGGG
jgi:hypothetical protein